MAPLAGLADAEAEAAALEWLPLAGAALSEAEATAGEGAALDSSALGAAAPAELMPWLFVWPPKATLEQIWPYTPLAMICDSMSVQSLNVSSTLRHFGSEHSSRREAWRLECGRRQRPLLRGEGWGMETHLLMQRA